MEAMHFCLVQVIKGDGLSSRLVDLALVGGGSGSRPLQVPLVFFALLFDALGGTVSKQLRLLVQVNLVDAQAEEKV